MPGPGKGNKKRVKTSTGSKSGKMTRKEAKSTKAQYNAYGHPVGGMSVRKIKKSGTKTSF